MSNRYGLYSAFFDNGGAGLPLPQVRSIGTRTNKSMVTIHPSGAIDPAAHIMSMARPNLSLATRDLATVFGTVSISAGYYCSDGARFMYRRRAVGGAFSASSEHVGQFVEAGFLHCTEISADAESQDAANCALEFIALSNDGGNPFTFTDDQAIHADLPAPAYGSSFFMGPAYYNSSLLPGLIRARVRPGISFQSRLCDGGSFPRAAASSINSRNPQIELEFLKVDMADSIIGDLLVAAFSSTLAVYFQKGATNNEGRVAAATSQHVKVSAAAGSWGADDVSVAGEDDATLTILIQPTGTLSLTTASAIP